jgi:3-hydroxyacyl-CoA dehydrogenase/3a,7a,12a-trihydroxy-5b-cholest-24-enoyl-CoA hydratase
MALRFDGQAAVVTGAGRGLGREYALLLAARGAKVVVNNRTPEKADEVVAEIKAAGGLAVADYSDVASAAEKVRASMC